MSEDNINFIKLASSIVSHFNGENDKLQTFINSVELLQKIVTGIDTNIIIQFIKTRLGDSALVNLPSNITSVDQILNSLKSTYKFEHSTIIEGKLCAIKVNYDKLSNFTDEIDRVGQLLLRSLTWEGCSKTKSEEIVKNKVVEICRAAARNEFIRTVIASSSFETYRDVLAKFSLESAKIQDSQLLKFNTNPRRDFQNSWRYPSNPQTKYFRPNNNNQFAQNYYRPRYNYHYNPFNPTNMQPSRNMYYRPNNYNNYHKSNYTGTVHNQPTNYNFKNNNGQNQGNSNGSQVRFQGEA